MTEIAVEDLPDHLRSQVEVLDVDVPQTVDYFATTDTHEVLLPDGVQWVRVKEMNEGERKKYQNQTNRDVRMNRKTQELVLKSAVGDDMHLLLQMAIVDWYVVRAGQSLAFTRHSLEQALDSWPPTVVDHIARAVRKYNPWLTGTEDDLDAMREEYKELGERITELESRAAKSG